MRPTVQSTRDSTSTTCVHTCRVPGALLVAALAVALPSCAGRPPVATTQVPRSMIVITVDTLRADRLDAARMPALHRLSQQAVTFDQAVSVGPVTLPGHASLLTGLFPPRHGARDNAVYALAPEVETFTAALKARGYATGAFVSAIVLDKRYGLARGFDVYDDAIAAEHVERDAPATFAAATRWISGVRQPFFLWVHVFEPHAPYRAGSYDAEVAIVDREIDAFTRTLVERGLWNDVVFSVTADHGESLGEHGERTHGYFLYDSTIRIPWVLRAPGRAPARVSHQVRLVDVLPTMADMAGQGALMAPGGPLDGIDGVSLVPVLDRGQVPRLDAYAETLLPRHQFNWSALSALRTDTAKFIEAPRQELYDLATDAAETTNVAAARPDVASGMKRTLGALVGAASPSARRSSDPLLAERFMSLGYIGYAPGRPSTSADVSRADPKDKLPVYLEVMDALDLAGRRETDAALQRIDRALALDPGIAQAHFLRATWLGDRGRYREAVASLERTIALSPRYVSARFKLALALLRLGDDRRAERELQVVINDEPANVRAWHNLAAIAYTRGDLDRAEELERKAIAIDPAYAEAWNTLGAVYVVRKRPDDAVAALQRAAALAPTNARTLANLALAFDLSGRAADAADARRRACAIDRQHCS